MKTLKPHPHVIKLLGSVTESGKTLTGHCRNLIGLTIVVYSVVIVREPDCKIWAFGIIWDENVSWCFLKGHAIAEL